MIDYIHVDFPTEELRRFGFNILTGEACNVGLRMLVDMTDQAAELYATFLGGCYPTVRNHNSGATRSAFVPREMFDSLMIFCLLSEKPERKIVYLDFKGEFRNSYYVFDQPERMQPYLEKWSGYGWDYRIWQTWNHPRVGLSNVHGFSGSYQ